MSKTGIIDYLSDSLEYTKEACAGKWKRYLILIIGTIIFPILIGYMIRIMRGISPAPELEQYVQLFIDGIKACIVVLIYLIIPIIVGIATVGAIIVSLISEDSVNTIMTHPNLILGVLFTIVIFFIADLFAELGIVRFARTGSMRSALEITEIARIIKTIGWVHYIIAFLVLTIITEIIMTIPGYVPLAGAIIQLIITPFICILSARYFSLLYDKGMTQ